MLRVLADIFTASRAAAALAILFNPSLSLSAVLVAWAAGSDFVDGWLARRSKRSSPYGATFDLTVDGLFFLACFLGVWRIGALPAAWLAALLAGVSPQLVAQALFLFRGRGVGSPGRPWNKILGGYSYCCVLGLALGGSVAWLVAPLVVLALWANGLDLRLALTSNRVPPVRQL